jgi:tetratricopeptide (TPR) repeat protein
LADVKVTKKDIQEARRPDAVLEGATSLFDWLLENKNLVIGLIVGVLVIVAGYSIAQNAKHKNFAEVGGQFSTALEMSTRTIAPKAEGAEVKVSGAETFSSKEEKEKAVDGALTAITKEHADSSSAKSASVLLAAQRFNEGKLDEAISLAESYTKSNEGSLRAIAFETLGNAYAAKGDAAKAEEAYKKVSDAGAPAQSLFLQAGLQEKAGKKDEARKLYEKVIADYEKEGVAREARSRLDLLDMPAPGTGALEAPSAPAEPAAPADKKAGKASAKTK